MVLQFLQNNLAVLQFFHTPYGPPLNGQSSWEGLQPSMYSSLFNSRHLSLLEIFPDFLERKETSLKSRVSSRMLETWQLWTMTTPD